MDRFELFQNLMAMAAADKKFTEEEVQFLTLRGSRWGLSDEQFAAALAGVQQGTVCVTIPTTPEERQLLLRNMLQTMAADGELAPVEKRLFASVAAIMNVTAEQLDRLIDDM